MEYAADANVSAIGDMNYAMSKLGKVYPQGCSGFTADVLHAPFKVAQQYHQGAAIGSNGNYTHITPGHLIGFPGHIGFYLGQPGKTFIDCRGPGQAVRTLSSYGAQTVYKYTY